MTWADRFFILRVAIRVNKLDNCARDTKFFLRLNKMGKGCPCANPPGAGKFKPVRQPKPRLPVNAKEISVADSEQKKSSRGLSLNAYLDVKYHDINNKILSNTAFYFEHIP
jgi:hypothetical protein